MERNILLVEPGFKTKFPPLGLMKISSYHRALGDNVRFIKGINHDAEYTYWDRIYVSTLFTYHWKITVETINYYKYLVRGDVRRIIVGGILASLMPEELWHETGVKPLTGVLDCPSILDDDNKLVVEHMLPDYTLFNDYPSHYRLINDSFFGYSTRGCPNKCKFCGVHVLEPKFKEYNGLKPYVNGLRSLYGDRPYLVLFDNNILASKRLNMVVNDIEDLGFSKDNPFTYVKNKRTIKRARGVDFNQGTDLRLMTESKLKILSRLPLNPLRIAFDHVKDTKNYIAKVKLAAKYEIQRLSNYVLYNYDDTPEDLWRRLKINIDLNKELNLQIYSFPMKYIPLNAKDRSHISKPTWNWQFIRGVQRILNVLKGTVMTNEDFFYRAFGSNEKEFIEILHMPEKIILYRGNEASGVEIVWLNKFRSLTFSEKGTLLNLISENHKKNDLLAAIPKVKSQNLKDILGFYVPEEKSSSLFDHI